MSRFEYMTGKGASANLGVEGGHLSLGTRVVFDDAIDRLWDKLQDEIKIDLVQLQEKKNVK